MARLKTKGTKKGTRHKSRTVRGATGKTKTKGRKSLTCNRNKVQKMGRRVITKMGEDNLHEKKRQDEQQWAGVKQRGAVL